MKPTLHHRNPNASCVGRGVVGVCLGARLARFGLRFDGVAIHPVQPGIAAHQSS